MARELAHESDSDAEPRGEEDILTPASDYEQLNTDNSLLGRRGYLKLGAAAAAVAAGLGSSRARAAENPGDFNFNRVVNARDDLGWDPNGNRAIDGSLGNNIVDGTLIEVPPGTYLVKKTHRVKNLRNWGIRGLGNDKGDVRFVVPEGSAQRIFNIRDNSRNILVQNLTFDQYDTWRTSIGNVFQVDDGLLIKDVEYAGRNPSENRGAVSSLNVYIWDSDGVAVLDGVVRKGPTELVDYPKNALAVFSGGSSDGTIIIRNCHFENCGEHAIYASRCKSSVQIENSFFKNNQNTHARISGTGSWVKDSVFVWDADDHPNKGDFQAQTGMVFEGGWRGKTGGLVENCDFICHSTPKMSGCLKVDGSHGGLTVRNCRFLVDAPGAEPFWADAPGDSHMIDGKPDKPWDLTLENVSISGNGLSQRDHTGAIQVDGRDGSVFRNICIDMTGDRDGIVLINSDDCTIADANITVPGDATVFKNSSADTSNITSGGSCPLPNEDFSSSSGPTTWLPNSLSVRAPDGVNAVTYAFTVTGSAALTTDGEDAATPKSAGGDEEITTNPDGTTTVTGVVADGGGDTFGYSGDVIAFAADGDPVVHRNDEQVAPDDLGLPNWLLVKAPDGADAFEYEFTVDGDAELVTSGEYAATPKTNGLGEEVIENQDGTSTVTGIVANGGGDMFAYDGVLTDFAAGGDAIVYRNGKEFDTSQFGLPNTLTVVAPDGADAFEYEFTVDGDAELVTSGEYAATPKTNGVGEEVSHNPDGTCTVTGIVANGGGDTFGYSGQLIAFAAAGEPIVYENGEEIDHTQFGLPNTLQVIAPEGSPAIEYEVTVSEDAALVTTGEYAAVPKRNGVGEEVIKNQDGTTTVIGVVANGGGDTFNYAGEIVDFVADGDPIIYRNGERVSFAEFGLSKELTIAGMGSVVNYEFTVTGHLASNPDGGALETEDTISGVSAEGVVLDGTDSYLFSGTIADFSLDGEADVSINGEQVDPTDLGLDHELQIVGSGVETAQYAFTVDGELVFNPDRDPASDNAITGNSATGTVTDGVDSYLFSGGITSFSLDGPAGVYLDGNQVDPQLLEDSSDAVLPNWFVVDGTDGTACEYSFTVTGNVKKSPDLGSIEPDDVIEDAIVSGSVDGDADGYRFSGDLTRLLVEGNARVTFEDVDG